MAAGADRLRKGKVLLGSGPESDLEP